MPFIIDSSFALACVLPDESSAAARTVLQRCDHDTIVVPVIWSLEIINGVLTASRRGRISDADVARILEALFLLPVQTDAHPDTQQMRAIMQLGRTYHLTSYDASYLECAARNDIPLATLDKKLRAAAHKHDIEVLG